MAAALPLLGPSDLDDPSRPDTPLASQNTTFHRPPIIETPIGHSSLSSSISPLQSPSSSENGQFLLPVASINKPQHLFSLSDVINAEDESIGPLPAEMESADLAVARTYSSYVYCKRTKYAISIQLMGLSSRLPLDRQHARLNCDTTSAMA